MNSSKLSRLIVIHELISSDTFPSLDKLRKECSRVVYKTEDDTIPSIKLIEKDIEFLRNKYDAPILYHKGQKGYYYKDDFLFLMPFDSSNLETIKLSLTKFRHLEDSRIMNSVKNAIKRYESRNRVYVRSTRLDFNEFIEFETPFKVKGVGLIDIIFQAIKTRKSIRFKYKSYWDDKTKQVKLKPHILKEHERWWYCVGYNTKEELKVYALDRMQTIPEILNESFKRNKRFDSRMEFKHSFGITLKNRPELIELSFKPRTGQYIKSKPLHSSQKIIADNNDEVRIQMIIYESPELWRKIMSYGSDVKIIKPESLKNMVIDSFKKAIEQYEK